MTDYCSECTGSNPTNIDLLKVRIILMGFFLYVSLCYFLFVNFWSKTNLKEDV